MSLANRTRPLRRLAVAATAALATSAVVGCDLDRVSDAEALRLSNPVYRHPIAVEAHRSKVELAAGHGKGDQASAYLEATRFIRQYRRDGRGPLTISYARHDSRMADGIRQLALHNGVPSRHIRMSHRHDGLHAITLAYDGVVAKGPECGDWSEDAGRDPSLIQMPNFGCASRRNLAHMVAEPTDLLFPQLESPRGSDRRATTYREYTGQKSGGTTGSSGAPSTAPGQ